MYTKFAGDWLNGVEVCKCCEGLEVNKDNGGICCAFNDWFK